MKSGTYVRQLAQRLHGHEWVVGLPETGDARTQSAANALVAMLPDIRLVGPKPSSVQTDTAWISPEELNPQILQSTYDALVARRGHKLTPQQMKELAAQPLYQCAYLTAQGTIDANVAGAVETTAQVIRTGLAHIDLSPGNKTVSGSLLMINQEHTWVFADSGVMIAPSAEQLVDCAGACVETLSILKPDQIPVVGFLSFSTKGSAPHKSSEKMNQAACEFSKRYPEVLSDGELQFDAAIDHEIGLRKGCNPDVAGQVNIFIFPDLGAGNIGYKIAQRLGGFAAIGPILQGFAASWSDLSRGASSEDIVISVLIGLLRSQKARNLNL